MKRFLVAATALLSLFVSGAARADAPCQDSDVVWLFEHGSFDGGCLGFNSDGDLTGHTFHNGVEANDGVSSLDIIQGYRVILHEHAGFQGAWKDFVGLVSFVGGDWNDRASSVSIVAGSCPSDAIVKVYVHADFGGGCKTFDQDDRDFFGNSFDDGTPLNDQISSIVVKAGYRAVLYGNADFSGPFKSFEGSHSNIDHLNDMASSLLVQDTTPPTGQVTSFTTVMVAGVSPVSGEAASERSVVSGVQVIFRPVTFALSPETSVWANSNCNPDGKFCTWSTVVPSELLPGEYAVFPRVYDSSGNVGTGNSSSAVIA